MLLWMSSVKGARKETFLGEGNIGRVLEKDLRRRRQPWGPLVRMEW
jgi:hypothetical protein